MDSEINQLNQLLGQENSFNMASVVNTLNGGRLPFQARNHQSLFSPANNQIRNRMFLFHTPSPFRPQQCYYEDQNSRSPDCVNYQHQGFNKNNISKVIQFDQSPKFKPISAEPSTIPKVPKIYEFSSTSHHKRNNRKNSKGLRSLSQSVYKIVLDRKVTTYKQVAEELVRMLNDGEFGEIRKSEDRNKDQQNIKRRVYDALNVLISADVLKKNNKYVMSDGQIDSQKLKLSEKLSNSKESASELLQKISKKTQEIRYKKEILNNLKSKKQLLNAIIKRNRKEKTTPQNKIYFPLVGAIFTKHQPNSPVTATFSQNKSIIKLSNLKNISIMIGDLDMLLKIGLDVMKQSIDEIMWEDKSCSEQFLIKQEIISPEEQIVESKPKTQQTPLKKENIQKEGKKLQKKLLYSL